MVDRRISDYLRNGLGKGYSLESLKEELLKQGFSEGDIDANLQAAKEFSQRKLWISVGVVIILATFLGLYINSQQINLGNLNLGKLSSHEKTLIRELINQKNSSCDNDYRLTAIEFALKKNESRVCDILKANNSRIGCFFEVAKKTNDYSVCDKIQHSQERFICYSLIALQTKNYSICDFSEDKELCKFYISFSISNETGCSDLSSDFRIACMANLERGTSSCEKIMDKDFSRFCQAVKGEDSSLCDKIGYENLMINSDECYSTLAQIKKDPYLCEMIKDPFLGSSCIRFFKEDPICKLTHEDLDSISLNK